MSRMTGRRRHLLWAGCLLLFLNRGCSCDEEAPPGGGEPLIADCVHVLPGLAAVSLGDEVAFRLETCDGEPLDVSADWKADTVGEGAAGTMDSGGRYTAPASLPDPPVVRVTAELGDGVSGEAVVELTEMDAVMTCAQAVEILIADVLSDTAIVEDPETVTAVGPHQIVLAGSELRQASVSDPDAEPETTVLDGDAWFFLVDHHPLALFHHEVSYVWIDAVTGAVHHEAATAPPEIDGVLWFDDPYAPFTGPWTVYEGADARRDLFEALVEQTNEADAWLESQESGRTIDGLDVDRLFPLWTETACDCVDPQRYALVVDGMNPSETLAAIMTADSADLMTRFFRQADFHTRKMSTAETGADNPTTATSTRRWRDTCPRSGPATCSCCSTWGTGTTAA